MFPPPPDPPAIVGQASVIDGDSIEIHGQRIRLWGIDAPESGQTCERGGEIYRCGQQAALWLARDIGDQVVTCIPHGPRDRYRRSVAKCSVNVVSQSEWEAVDVPLDLAGGLVAVGWALDYARYSGGEYAEIEAMARESRNGMHAGTFTAPWEWRHSRATTP